MNARDRNVRIGPVRRVQMYSPDRVHQGGPGRDQIIAERQVLGQLTSGVRAGRIRRIASFTTVRGSQGNAARGKSGPADRRARDPARTGPAGRSRDAGQQVQRPGHRHAGRVVSGHHHDQHGILNPGRNTVRIGQHAHQVGLRPVRSRPPGVQDPGDGLAKMCQRLGGPRRALSSATADGNPYCRPRYSASRSRNAVLIRRAAALDPSSLRNANSQISRSDNSLRSSWSATCPAAAASDRPSPG